MSDYKIMIRVSEEERAEITKKAGDTPLATYIRNTVLGSTTPSPATQSDVMLILNTVGEDILLDSLVQRTKGVRQLYNSEDPAKKAVAIDRLARTLEDMILSRQTVDEDPTKWSIVTNPDGEDKPYLTEDGEYILSITDGHKSQLITPSHEWWGHFTRGIKL